MNLTYTEAQTAAEYLSRMWEGVAGTEQPKPEALADIVQITLRKAREIVAGREG
jgi:hypothetical protein